MKSYYYAHLSRDRACQLMVDALMASFDHAYRLHAMDGQSEDEILITHDIVAAGSDMSEAIVNAHRKVIKTAIEAVDGGVSFNVAHETLRLALTTQAEELLANEAKQKQPKRRRQT
jgi:hypothetical protein